MIIDNNEIIYIQDIYGNVINNYILISKNGDKFWYKNEKRHREDGPAVEYASGTKAWYQNGKLHRLNGPAIEWANGTKSWWQNGNLHRLAGPAIEYANGNKEWWIDGVKYKEKCFNQKVKELDNEDKR